MTSPDTTDWTRRQAIAFWILTAIILIGITPIILAIGTPRWEPVLISPILHGFGLAVLSACTAWRVRRGKGRAIVIWALLFDGILSAGALVALCWVFTQPMSWRLALLPVGYIILIGAYINAIVCTVRARRINAPLTLVPPASPAQPANIKVLDYGVVVNSRAPHTRYNIFLVLFLVCMLLSIRAFAQIPVPPDFRLGYRITIGALLFYGTATAATLLVRLAFPARRNGITTILNGLLLLCFPIGTAIAIYGMRKLDRQVSMSHSVQSTPASGRVAE